MTDRTTLCARLAERARAEAHRTEYNTIEDLARERGYQPEAAEAMGFTELPLPDYLRQLIEKKDAAEARVLELEQALHAQRKSLGWVLAVLRHAYENVHGGRVSQRGQQAFADGLLAPQIRKLEQAANQLDALLTRPAGEEP